MPELVFVDLADRLDIRRCEAAELQEHVSLCRCAVAHDGRAGGAQGVNELDEVGAVLEDAFFESRKGAGV